MSNIKNDRMAVLIPCLNEEVTIGKVIDDFRRELPQAMICVFDNGSTDNSAAIARNHGARVYHEPREGKGFVVECMFEHVMADIYVMVDGDDTYPAESVHALIDPVINNKADMAVGARLSLYGDQAFRPMHLLGNLLIQKLVNRIRQTDLTDILSGYRVFNRRVVTMLPVVSTGFEIETELTVQMLYYKRKIVEIQIPYRNRPQGSTSKLHTVKDGIRVLWKLFSLLRAIKPLTFFGSMGMAFFFLSLASGYLPIHDYLSSPDHYVRHVPLAILATGLMLISVGSVFMGVLLHAINWRFIELHSVLTRSCDTYSMPAPFSSVMDKKTE
ncbi:MAG: glycosyltransferase family 2 protein [Proteobacteria bacterium]|nr:glycosyltransferase family 2 protein [Pseudomonadota bacterium]